MGSPDSKISAPLDTTEFPTPKPRGRWPIIFALLVFHISILATVISLAPPESAFKLGEYSGSILVFGCPALWLLLFLTRQRWGISWFCILALAQTGFIGLVVHQLRAEDRALQLVGKTLAMERSEGESQMQQFRVDSLFEMTSGKRQLSIAELRELQIRARSGEEKWLQLHSDHVRSLSDAERRLAATGSRLADDFRRGVETRSQRLTKS
jgi:hypothetical protein